MKIIKKIVSLICVFMLAASCCANAAAVRKDIKQSGVSIDRTRKNDISFIDFSGADFSPNVTGTSNDEGEVYLDAYEVIPRLKKNCLVVNDTSYGATYEGVSAKITTGTQTGLVGVEIRYMYDLEEETGCTYGSFIMGLYDGSNKMISRHVIASNNGSSQFNYGGPSGKAMESTKIAPNTWYTIKWVLDLDKQKMDFSLLNEGTHTKTTAYDADWYTEGAGKNLARVDLQSSMYGGKYVFDYVRISKETSRMSESDDDETDDGSVDAGKGTESEKIAAPSSTAIADRININLDGIYKFTTQKPYEKDGKVMITAKNLASFFHMGYVKEGATCLIKTPNGILMIKNGVVTLDDNSVSLAAEEKGEQIFISVEDLCTALGGYDCSYDSIAKTVNISTVKAEDVKGINNAEDGDSVEK